MLELLTTSLRETSDYRIFQRRFVFKLLITFYQSVLSDNWCKVKDSQLYVSHKQYLNIRPHKCFLEYKL